MHKVDFYYDIVSPYSFIAFEYLNNKADDWHLDINYCPFFLGGVMKATGNSGPIFLAAKAPYLLLDIHRQARFHNLPMKIPMGYPCTNLTTQRFLTAVKVEDPSLLAPLNHALWIRHFGEGKSVNLPKDIQICSEQAGIPQSKADRWIEQIQHQDIKDKLKATTQEAVDRGAFGAPTFFIQKDGKEDWVMFFGSDRMHLVKEYLKVQSN